jgi:hypothetical protein
MEDKDYPNYFIAGDRASLEAQRKYICLSRVGLIITFIASFISIFEWEYKYHIILILFFLTFIISIILKEKSYGDIWYNGRALAESCKTLTWRFMMNSELFEKDLSEKQASENFYNNIESIVKEIKDVSKNISIDDDTTIITDKMKKIRQSDLKKRKDFYLNYRINNQIIWYSKKEKLNAFYNNLYYYIMIISYVLSFMAISYLICDSILKFNFIGVFTTFSASIFSWMQLKKYRENKDAYRIALNELNIIKGRFKTIESEEDFVKFVLDSENAMSREHTLWLAQRRV